MVSNLLKGAVYAAAFLMVVPTTGVAAAPVHPAGVGASAAAPTLELHKLKSQTVRPFFISHAAALAVAGRPKPAPAAGAIAPNRSARVGRSAADYARLKAGARHSNAPKAPAIDIAGAFLSSPNVATTATSDSEGLANSGIICPIFPGGCQPPDQALAASTTAVIQGVNDSVAVYDAHSGIMRLGWPLNFDAFLGGAPSAKVASCDPSGPFLSDPRAFYDPTDKRFFVSIGQFDAPGFSGPNDTCAPQSTIWIATSVDANPDDGFYVVGLDASEGGVSLADYPRLGFDDKTVEVSTNSFNFSDGFYTRSPMFYLSKYDLENGILTTAPAISVSYGGVPLDTMQPVETLAPANKSPGVIYNVASFNINFGFGGCFNGCSNVVVVAYANPLSPRATFAGTLVSTPLYLLPPNADGSICGGFGGCIETLDTRISATPTYNATANGGGAISWALETGAANATQIVPSILWGIIDTAPTHGDPIGNFAAKTRKTGFIVGQGDIANSFGATMLSNAGTKLSIVADVMGNVLYPGQVAYAYDGSGLRGLGVLHRGIAPDLQDFRWGDYSATSFDGSNVWVAGQYSGGNGDWATSFAKLP